MQQNSDSSLLKGLAIAFGNGLAVGVGMKLLQTKPAARQPVIRAARAPEPELDQKAVDAMVHALEARLREHAGHLEQRIAGLEAGIDEDLKTLNSQDESLAQRIEENLSAMRAEIVEMHREFAEAVGRIVAKHVHTEVSGRLKESEDRNLVLSRRVEDEMRALRSEVAKTRLDVAETLGRALTDQVDAAVQAALGTRLAPVLQFAGVVNQACSELTARIATPGAPPDGPALLPAESPIAVVPDEPAPAGPQFAQLKRSSELWRIPLVSSFILTAGALVLTHYM